MARASSTARSCTAANSEIVKMAWMAASTTVSSGHGGELEAGVTPSAPGDAQDLFGLAALFCAFAEDVVPLLRREIEVRKVAPFADAEAIEPVVEIIRPGRRR